MARDRFSSDDNTCNSGFVDDVTFSVILLEFNNKCNRLSALVDFFYGSPIVELNDVLRVECMYAGWSCFMR